MDRAGAVKQQKLIKQIIEALESGDAIGQQIKRLLEAAAKGNEFVQEWANLKELSPYYWALLMEFRREVRWSGEKVRAEPRQNLI